MRIYFAGEPSGGGSLNEKANLINIIKHKLNSYFHSRSGGRERGTFLQMLQKKDVHLFLDSGAYSAKTQGVNINIYEYIDFIKKHQSHLEVYANLDVIGDAKKTWLNQKIMESAGLKPLPVFHHMENENWLVRYLEAGYDYIGIGGLVGLNKSGLHQFLDRIFLKHLVDGQGYPRVKLHGFGLTNLKSMLRYPWYSVDSTSWVLSSRMGGIYVPRYKSGKWIYDENPWKITVSNRSPDHILNAFSPKEQEIILQYIHAKGYSLGKSRFERVSQSHELTDNQKWAEKRSKDKKAKRLLEIVEEEGLCNRYQLRDEINIIYFQDLEKSMPEWPWPFRSDKRKMRFF